MTLQNMSDSYRQGKRKWVWRCHAQTNHFLKSDTGIVFFVSNRQRQRYVILMKNLVWQIAIATVDTSHLSGEVKACWSYSQEHPR